MPHVAMEHAKNPKEALLEALGDFNDFHLFNNQVLCAVYIRPEKTAKGIILPNQARDEDRFQSKVGLIIKAGPTAFKDPDGRWFADSRPRGLEWAVFRASDGWNITVNKVLCRLLDDISIRGTVNHPDLVY